MTTTYKIEYYARGQWYDLTTAMTEWRATHEARRYLERGILGGDVRIWPLAVRVTLEGQHVVTWGRVA